MTRPPSQQDWQSHLWSLWLSSIPTYFLTIFTLPAWARKEMDQIRRSFMWKEKERANGGHCLVNWGRVKQRNKLGGLGISDLQRFGRSLRLQWLWLEWVSESKSPIHGLARMSLEMPQTDCFPIRPPLWLWGTQRTLNSCTRIGYMKSLNLYILFQHKNRSVSQEPKSCNNDAWMRARWGRITDAT